MLYRLIFLSGPNAGQQQTVLRPTMTMGSGADCGICIADEEMASNHAIFEHDDTGLMIRDLGTMHKIIVNHHQVDKCRLKHGDEIEIGRTRFLLQATVRAEVNAAMTAESTERKARRLSPMVVIYIITGLSIAYLFARTFLTLPDPDSDPLTHLPDPATGTTIRATSTVSNPTTGVRPPIRAHTTSLAITTTDRTNSRPVLNVTTNVIVVNPVAVASNITQLIITRPAPTVPVAVPDAVPAAVPAIPVPPRTNRITTHLPVVLPSVPVIKIVSTEQNKFPSTDSYQEMRTLTIKLKQAATIDIEPDSVTMEVIFYDRDNVSGDVFPSRMIAPQNPMKIAGPWNQDLQKVTTATYTVPSASTFTGVRLQQFYGFTIRIFQAGILQDQTCKPADLRTFMPK
ncbi:MAG: FHA domain-containing protein [bacterium]